MLIVPRPYFVGAPTTDDERKVLQRAGYVHLTGLWFFTRDHHGNASHGNYVGEGIVQEEMGTWNDFDQQSVIVTERGEVWMRTGSSVVTATDLLCPKGRGNYRPFDVYDNRPIDGMTCRIANPGDKLIYLS